MLYRKDVMYETTCSVLSIGIGAIASDHAAEAESLLHRAVDSGVNMFDLCAGSRNVYEAAGHALSTARDRIQLAIPIGMTFDEMGEYEWTRDMVRIRRNVAWQLRNLDTEYADFGVLHFIEDEDDARVMQFEGMLEYAKKLKRHGEIKKLAFSTHRPDVAARLLDIGVFDAAFVAFGQECVESRAVLERCRDEGVSVYVMDIFSSGDLLRNGLTPGQCLTRALEMPGVVSAVADITNTDQLNVLLESI